MELDDFRLLNGRVLIEADKTKNHAKKIKRADGTEVKLWYDTRVNPNDHDRVCADGIVLKTPITLKPGSPKLDIEEGDHVYCFYFLTDEPEHKQLISGKETYTMDYHCDFITYMSTNFYCKVKDGKISMIADWNLIEPIEEKEKIKSSILFIPDVAEKKGNAKMTKGILRHVSKCAREKELKEGDVVYFNDIYRFDLVVEGSHYFRVSSRDISLLEEK